MDDRPEEIPRERSLLREFLADHDVDCPQCHYNLRNLTGDRCPECGEQLALGVHLIEPRLAAPIAGVVGLAAGAGLNGLLIVYWLIVSIFYRRGGGPWNRFVFVNLINGAVLGTGMFFWLKNWRRIRAASPIRRWILVAGCWLLSLADLVVFTIVIR
jgi:hypothetical protein